MKLCAILCCLVLVVQVSAFGIDQVLNHPCVKDQYSFSPFNTVLKDFWRTYCFQKFLGRHPSAIEITDQKTNDDPDEQPQPQPTDSDCPVQRCTPKSLGCPYSKLLTNNKGCTLCQCEAKWGAWRPAGPCSVPCGKKSESKREYRRLCVGGDVAFGGCWQGKSGQDASDTKTDICHDLPACGDHCAVLPEIENGNTFCSDGDNLGSVCQFQCNILYERSGLHEITCQENKRWSGNAPYCRFRP